ncbi:unnamed protein product [Rhizophagus irregularis]|nr:unnamed protein product [Rhizophagus irregularis]
MDVSELNVQEFTLIIPHEEEELGQVCQNDTNKDIEQVELSDTTEPQNLESKDSTTDLCIGCIFKSWDDVDNVMEGFVIETVKQNAYKLQCPWNANFNRTQNSQIIKLTTFNNSHNHMLFPADTEKYSPKYRCIPDDVLKEVQFLTEHGNLAITIQRKLLKAKFPTLSILNCDLANAIQKYKVKPDIVHDASHLLKTLIEYKSNSPGWFIEFQLDQENRLSRLFWMSPTQIALWLEYHDVILNDNTMKTNRYNMPLSLFLAIDNNIRSCLIAQALVSDEITESYKWILECTKKATMIEPLVFVTDTDHAMDAAIEQIYETAYPIHCIFHISENLPKNTKSKLSNQYDDLVRDFYHCRNSLCEELFYERWAKLIEKYSSVKDYLMRTLYPSRRAWARVEVRGESDQSGYLMSHPSKRRITD